MIGKIKKVQLREIWEHEARNFTTWMSENIDSLNEFLELNLTVTEKEKSVGPFSSDIVAADNQGNVVIIENQLEKTNHDHLGKLVTYLSNIDNAKMAIWISSDPVEEHRRAVEWLNEFTPKDVSFYLVKVEAVQIGDSIPAPLFSIIAQPTEFVKQIGKENAENAERNSLRREFWTQLLELANSKTKVLSNISPGKYNWISTGAGKTGITYGLSINLKTSSVYVYIDKGKEYQKLNKERFDYLFNNKIKIDKMFGDHPEWHRLDSKRASIIDLKFDKGLTDKENWPTLQEKMIDSFIRMKDAFDNYVKELK